MGFKAPDLSLGEFAEAIAPVDTFWTVSGKEFVIDSADYHKQDGSILLEGYIEDKDGDKHYIEAHVSVEELVIDNMPYDRADADLYDDEYEEDEEDEED